MATASTTLVTHVRGLRFQTLVVLSVWVYVEYRHNFDTIRVSSDTVTGDRRSSMARREGIPEQPLRRAENWRYELDWTFDHLYAGN